MGWLWEVRGQTGTMDTCWWPHVASPQYDPAWLVQRSEEAAAPGCQGGWQHPRHPPASKPIKWSGMHHVCVGSGQSSAQLVSRCGRERSACWQCKAESACMGQILHTTRHTQLAPVKPVSIWQPSLQLLNMQANAKCHGTHEAPGQLLTSWHNTTALQQKLLHSRWAMQQSKLAVKHSIRRTGHSTLTRQQSRLALQLRRVRPGNPPPG